MKDKLDNDGIAYNTEITERGLLEEAHNLSIAKTVIPKFELPQGFIVEYGSWRGSVIDELSRRYGVHRVFGFEIGNFFGHLQIHDFDVRHLAGNRQYQRPIALAWNDLSDWNGSPMGKQAAFDHALTNLVDGGIYIEHRKCPDYILSHPNLTLIDETKHLLFFRFND